jgi:hypothetical protein
MGSSLNPKSTRARAAHSVKYIHKRGRKPARPKPPKVAAASDAPHTVLSVLRAKLELIQSSATVVARVLNDQNCELDADAARILFRHIVDPLMDQIVSIDRLLEGAKS